MAEERGREGRETVVGVSLHRSSQRRRTRTMSIASESLLCSSTIVRLYRPFEVCGVTMLGTLERVSAKAQ